MKNWKNLLILVILATFALGMAACGGGSEDTEPAAIASPATMGDEPLTAPSSTPLPTAAATDTPVPTPTPAPTDTPEAAEPSGAGEGLDTGGLSMPENLTSYRSTMHIAMSGLQASGEEMSESIDFTIEFTTDPPAQHVLITGGALEAAGEGDTIEMYVVEDTMYMYMEGEWLSMPATEGELLSEGMITPDSVLDDTCGWTKEGDTELDGVEVEHWITTKEDMEACMPPEELASLGELSDAGGNLYIAKDEDYVAQMNLFFEGTNLALDMDEVQEEVNVTYMEIEFTMTDVNQPFTIDLPEDALASSALPEDIPVPPDAEEVNSMFGIITFLSPSTPAEVAEFYQAEMPNNGWTELSADEFSGMFMLEYTKDGRQASLMINVDDDTGKTSAMISVEEGQ